MKINEIFASIQGEGITIGAPTTFVRLAGCNLRCKWCDTKYAYEGGEELNIQQILERVKGYENKHVCVTGGEPLMQNDTVRLVDKLVEGRYFVTLETNGSISIEPFQCSETLVISMDIKCPSSGEESKMLLSNLEMLSPYDQLKFVIADKADYRYAKNILKEHKLACTIVMTPVGGIELKELVEWVLKDKLQVRVLPQLHKLVWGDVGGK
jgi:7-carboxy-7-deazaguanine synthase